MWVARDKSGGISLFTTKPFKHEDRWEYDFFLGNEVFINKNLFPEVTWEDEEPTEVKIIIDKNE